MVDVRGAHCRPTSTVMAGPEADCDCPCSAFCCSERDPPLPLATPELCTKRGRVLRYRMQNWMQSTAAVAIAQLQRGSVLTDRPRLLDPRPPFVVLVAGGAGTGRGCGASNEPVSTAPGPASLTDGADPAAAGAAWPPTPMYIHGNACSAPLSSPPPAFLGGVGRAGGVTENGRTTCRYLSQGIHERVDIQISTGTSAAIGHNRHIQERAIS
jgi:hypothetical protein